MPTEAADRDRVTLPQPSVTSKHLSPNGHINPYFTARLASYTYTHKCTHVWHTLWMRAHAFSHICPSRCFWICFFFLSQQWVKTFWTNLFTGNRRRDTRRMLSGVGEIGWKAAKKKSIRCNAAYGNLCLLQEGLIHSPGVVRDRCGM